MSAKIKKCVDYGYKVGDKIMIVKDGILRKAESPKEKETSTITTVHTNVIRGRVTARMTADTEKDFTYHGRLY